MKVSVLIITYNQEEVVAQAVNSALMQEVNFPYEIVIGEDVSTDRTREIVLEFQKQHPDKIRVMLRDPATSERDRARGLGGKTNFVQGLQDCRGEYVALLDGDDYWTSPHKLQKQVDFLDTHPECALCFHDVLMIFDDGKTEPRNFSSPHRKPISTVEDLLSENFIPTCSVLYRRRPQDEFPEWLLTTPTGDWGLHIINARHGKIGYLNEVMGVYRIHRGGNWSLTKRTRQIAAAIRMLDQFNEYLEHQFEKAIRRAKGRLYYQLADEFYAGGHLGYARSFLKRSLLYRHFKQRGLPNLLLRLHAPTLYKLLKRSKSVIHAVISSSTAVRLV